MAAPEPASKMVNILNQPLRRDVALFTGSCIAGCQPVTSFVPVNRNVAGLETQLYHVCSQGTSSYLPSQGSYEQLLPKGANFHLVYQMKKIVQV